MKKAIIKFLQVLRKSFYEYSDKQSVIIDVLQVFWIFCIFVFLVLLFFSYALLLSLLIKYGLEKILGGIFSKEGQWIVYGLIFGMALSMLIQSVQKEKQSPSQLMDTLLHHLFYFIIILYAIAFWILVATI